VASTDTIPRYAKAGGVIIKRDGDGSYKGRTGPSCLECE
jgi:hypothetical protein